MVLVLYAHPYPDRSRAHRALLRAVEGTDGIIVRSLYDRYPDLAVDVAAEQHALESTRTFVLQHPLYWHAPPALVAMWLEKVLVHDWAFLPGGALRGKRCLWVVSTGSGEMEYADKGAAPLELDQFAAPMRHAMTVCGVEWLPPIVIHGSRTMRRADLDLAAADYRRTLVDLVATDGDAHG